MSKGKISICSYIVWAVAGIYIFMLWVQAGCGYYTVSQKHDYIFDDKLNWDCPFTTIFGTLITKSVGHRQMFLFSYHTYFMHLLYLGKLPRPKY